MDYNALHERVRSEISNFVEFIPGIWERTPVELRRLFLQDVLVRIPEARECMDDCLTAEGLGKLAESEFDDLPMAFWVFIWLAFDIKTRTFSYAALRERLERIG